MKKRALRVAAAVALSFGLIAVPAITASANTGISYTNGNVLRASAGYTQSTRTFTVTDRANDGWGARVRVDRIIGADFWFDNTGGANTTVSRQYISPANDSIKLQACSINNGLVVGCSGWSASSAV